MILTRKMCVLLPDIPLPTAVGREQLFQINLKGVAIEDNVDFQHLISITEGYSGADLANVCRDAAMMPLRKQIKEGKIDIMKLAQHKDNIQELQAEIQQPLTQEDFLEAIRNVNKSVNQAQLDEYSQWMAEFGSS